MQIPVPYILKGNEVQTTVEGVTGVPFPAGLPSTEETNDNDNDNDNKIVEGE